MLLLRVALLLLVHPGTYVLPLETLCPARLVAFLCNQAAEVLLVAMSLFLLVTHQSVALFLLWVDRACLAPVVHWTWLAVCLRLDLAEL
jgi:hypothetical protein